MTVERRIKYRMDYYRRLITAFWRGDCVPGWLSSRNARFAYVTIFSVLIITYVCQVSSAAGIGYEMKDLQRLNETLKQEIRQLNVEVASHNALPNLEARIEEARLTKVQDIVYVRASDSVVAKK